MPNYAYRVVHALKGQRTVLDHFSPHPYDGTAEEFGRSMLLDFLATTPSSVYEYAGVNVWDWDRQGVGDPSQIAARVNTLEPEPRASNLLTIDHYTYYVVSREPDYNFTDDQILGARGTDNVHGMPQGLVVPGSGPTLKIRTGHQWGYISVDVSVLESGPAADLSAWDAVEQATIRPRAQVEICDWLMSAQDHFPDLTAGHRVDYLTIRVSARGRDAKADRAPAANARRAPVEHHLIEAWPTPALAPREVLKRDETTRYWESPTPNRQPPDPAGT